MLTGSLRIYRWSHGQQAVEIHSVLSSERSENEAAVEHLHALKSYPVRRTYHEKKSSVCRETASRMPLTLDTTFTVTLSNSILTLCRTRGLCCVLPSLWRQVPAQFVDRQEHSCWAPDQSRLGPEHCQSQGSAAPFCLGLSHLWFRD